MKSLATLCAAAVFALTIPAHARIGETEKEVEARYGAPVQKPKKESGREKERTYRFKDLEITVIFLDRKSQHEDITKLDGGKFGSDEIEAFLKDNSGGAEWKKKSEAEWELPSGTVSATYMDINGLPPKFTLETKEYNALLGSEVQPKKAKGN
jgi:hypothetical protein